MLTGIDCDSQWDIGNCCHNVGAATLIRRTRYGGEEGGAGYRLMDIKTRPQQGGIIDYPANMQCSLNAACWVTVVHRLIHFSSVCCRIQSQCRCRKPVLQISLLLPLPSLFLCLLSLKNESVQNPAAERDPVACPAQLGPLLNGMMGNVIL